MLHKLAPYLRHTLPLHGLASSRAIEAAALAGRPDDELMERAGLAIARLAIALQPGPGTIWIACGPGNNGGDGRIAARWLQAQGRAVHIGLEPPPGRPALAIDALLGLGLSRAPEGALAASMAAINSADAPVLAVDLPSGLRADTGQPLGEAVVRADHTLQLLTLKPGAFTAQGRDFCGEAWFDDLGITPEAPPDALLLGRDCLSALPARRASSHKGSHGDVLVVGGAPGMAGAALLAARAALAAGAGRVYAPHADPGRPELMHQAQPGDLRGMTVVAGCGGGREIASQLPALLRDAERLVLDADALNAIAADTAVLKARKAPAVLTPHPLEAARLLGCTTAEVQADRLRAAQTLAEELRCTVVLKGSGTVIASPGRVPAINSSGGPALATAGTGDVLAGWLGGLWAQQPQADPQALAGAAVFWHGLADETQAAGPLRAADLIERMHALHG